MKKILYFLLMYLLFLGGCEKENNKVEAEIIGFVPEKCNCCWGWEIKVGNDTIKADSLPDIAIIGYEIYSPVSVFVEIGKRKKDCSWQGPAYHFDYYEIKSLELKE